MINRIIEEIMLNRSYLFHFFMKKSFSKSGIYFCYEMYPQKGF